jgi:DNA polymerase I-like protein with 3'-5' exonuclease and polymerase domains
MRLVLDVENTTTSRGGKNHLDPFEPTNSLTQVGMLNADNPQEEKIITLDHEEEKDTSGSGKELIQDILNETTLLIMHNASHDLMWLWACGFEYEGAIYDTMLTEYLLSRGQKQPLSLGECAERRNLQWQKDDTLKRYFKEGYNTNEIPLNDLCFYLRSDLHTTCELFHDQEADFAKPESQSLHTVRQVTFDTCKTLTRMYMSGIKVDRAVLNQVRQEFEQEQADIEDRLMTQVRQLMGDTPINLNSPAQMSQVIFSREINDRKEWADIFEHVNDPKEFKQAVAANSKLITKTKAFTCPTCEGEGKTYKVKKDGTKYARPNKCKDCEARGFQLAKTKDMAGLGFAAPV